MASLFSLDVNVQFDNDRDLSDDQVQQLLQEAEDRLRARNAIAKTDSALRRSLPKLSHGMRPSYVKEKDGIAQVDSARLVDNEQRKLANTARIAAPLLPSKKTVSILPIVTVIFCMRKILHFKS